MIEQAVLRRIVPDRENAFPVRNAADRVGRSDLSEKIELAHVVAVAVGVDGHAGPVLQTGHGRIPERAFRTEGVRERHIPLGHEERLAVDPVAAGTRKRRCRRFGDVLVSAALLLFSPMPVVEIAVRILEVHVFLSFHGAEAGVVVRAADRDLHAERADVGVHLVAVLAHKFHPEFIHRLILREQLAVIGIVVDAFFLQPRREHVAEFIVVIRDQVIPAASRMIDEGIVFIDDRAHHEDRIVLVFEAGVRILMIPELLAEFLLQIDHLRIVHCVQSRAVVQKMRILHAVAGLEAPVRRHVDRHVNALILQALHEIIETLQTLFGEIPRILHALACRQPVQVRRGPLIVHLMEPDNVDAGLGQSSRDLLRFLVRRETGGAVEHDAPETRKRSVLEPDVLSVHFRKPMLPRRFFVLEHERNVDRHVVRMHVNRNKL